MGDDGVIPSEVKVGDFAIPSEHWRWSCVGLLLVVMLCGLLVPAGAQDPVGGALATLAAATARADQQRRAWEGMQAAATATAMARQATVTARADEVAATATARADEVAATVRAGEIAASATAQAWAYAATATMAAVEVGVRQDAARVGVIGDRLMLAVRGLVALAALLVALAAMMGVARRAGRDRASEAQGFASVPPGQVVEGAYSVTDGVLLLPPGRAPGVEVSDDVEAFERWLQNE